MGQNHKNYDFWQTIQKYIGPRFCITKIPTQINPEYNIFGIFVGLSESTSTHCNTLFKKATNQMSKNGIEAVCDKDCQEFRFLQFYICKYMCTNDFAKCRAAEPSFDFELYWLLPNTVLFTSTATQTHIVILLGILV